MSSTAKCKVGLAGGKSDKQHSKCKSLLLRQLFRLSRSFLTALNVNHYIMRTPA